MGCHIYLGKGEFRNKIVLDDKKLSILINLT